MDNDNDFDHDLFCFPMDYFIEPDLPVFDAPTFEMFDVEALLTFTLIYTDD